MGGDGEDRWKSEAVLSNGTAVATSHLHNTPRGKVAGRAKQSKFERQNFETFQTEESLESENERRKQSFSLL